MAMPPNDPASRRDPDPLNRAARPTWYWWVGGIVVLALLVFFFTGLGGSGRQNASTDATPPAARTGAEAPARPATSVAPGAPSGANAPPGANPVPAQSPPQQTAPATR